ncbi:hypothetical protein AWR38_00400 [Idiomarina sp. WRN-38]|nr:hypothetical protein AUR68_00400 [Idiomarina sp. H105]OAE97901.1 hypothetical protein AWR38_00400 [Idiomarina sp. WRN-38]
MIEAMMLGGSQGLETPWEYVGNGYEFSSALNVQGEFPSNVQPGDLLVAVISGRAYDGDVKDLAMITPGWTLFSAGTVDWVAATIYKAGMAPPVWEQPYSRYVRVLTFCYRNPGWSSIKLVSLLPVQSPVDVDVQARNSLILNIGNTPGTSGYWRLPNTGESFYSRFNNRGSPSLFVTDANIDTPRLVENVYAYTSDGGAIRNIILVAY